MIKLAEAYERKGQWYFQPSSQAPTGLWIATLPVSQITGDSSPKTKGEAALEALTASKEFVPMPEDTGTVILPLLKQAGVPSWVQFINNAKCVALELENDQLTLIPYRRVPRSKGALQGIPGTHIILSADASAAVIGSALEEAFSRCLP